MKTNTLDFDAQALRERILDLAMRGKLVPQDPNDEPASVLLEKIKAEKEELVKEKKIKKSKSLPAIADGEKPFDIPDNWEWVRLGDVGVWAAGATPSRRHPEYYGGNIPWLKTGDLNDGIVNETSEKITELGVKNSSVKVNKPGNVLIAMYGATIGKLGIVGEKELVTNQACCGCSLFDGVYNWYLFYYLLSSRKQLIDLGSGGAQPNISKNKIEKFVFPLPPLSEQSRIAAKIAQLFDLLHKIETSTQQYAKLQTLLKSKVLDLAMRGKLVKQDPNDEPASVLLEKIKAEKAELVKEKKIKKSKPLPSITDEEKPFDIPDSWEWVRLGDLTAPVEYAMADGPFGSNLKKADYTLDPEVRIIQLSNIGENGWKDQNVKYTTFEHLKSIQRSEVFPGNIVIAKMMPAGRAIIVPNKDKKYVLSSDAVKFIPDTQVYKDFLLYAINSNTYRDQVNEKLQGTTRPRTSLKKLKNFLIPLPPFDEQKRIIDELMQLFNLI